MTEQLYIAESKAKEADERCTRKIQELVKWQQRAFQLHKDKGKLSKDRDSQMREIQQSLLMFEASLRSEQRHINQLIYEKDCQIDKQRKEIHMYRALIISKARSDKMSVSNKPLPSGKIVKTNSKSELESVQEVDSFTDDSLYDSGSDIVVNVKSKHVGRRGVLPVDELDNLNDGIARNKWDACLTDNGLNKVNKIILNHRSVIKPKDVKNKRINKERSRSIDICENGSRNATVQYWTHPYI